MFCGYLFDTFAYFFIDGSVKLLGRVFEPWSDPIFSIKKLINKYLKAKSCSSVHSLASNSNLNTMILKLKKFKCQFISIKRNVSNNLFQKTIIKNYCNCVFIVLITFLLFTIQGIIIPKWIHYFFKSIKISLIDICICRKLLHRREYMFKINIRNTRGMWKYVES